MRDGGRHMQLTIRLLGTEILHLSTCSEPPPSAPDQDDRGDCTTSPVGFTAPPLAACA